MRPLQEGQLHIVVFADALFANNLDFSTQLGYCAFLSDDYTRANCLHYTS